jgi:hypothetical protein
MTVVLRSVRLRRMTQRLCKRLRHLFAKLAYIEKTQFDAGVTISSDKKQQL